MFTFSQAMQAPLAKSLLEVDGVREVPHLACRWLVLRGCSKFKGLEMGQKSVRKMGEI